MMKNKIKTKTVIVKTADIEGKKQEKKQNNTIQKQCFQKTKRCYTNLSFENQYVLLSKLDRSLDNKLKKHLKLQ